MKVASIVPIPYLELTRNSEYHLCLAHLVKDFPEYAQFYKERAKEGKFVILDNGAAEGQALPIKMLLEMALEIGASELVLPDIIGNPIRTIDESYKALHFIKQYEDERIKKLQLMVVPHGHSIADWISCARAMAEWPVHTIGVPKALTYAYGPYGRIMALSQINKCSQSIHLLGCAYDPREVGAIYWMLGLLPHVRGVDSSIAYLYARDGLNLLTAIMDGIPRSQEPINFLDEQTNPGLISSNIIVWERMCRGDLL